MSKYPWQTIDPKDSILIEAGNALTIEDIRVLTKLYQPIIGVKAQALYQTLFAELNMETNNQSMMISTLLRKLDFGIPDFYDARIRLEGIGLLRIYEMKDEESSYYYHLILPLNAEKFFKDSLLSTMLIEKIGEYYYRKELREFLPKLKLKEDYTETTRSFLDVYHMNFNEKNIQDNTQEIPQYNSQAKVIPKTIENVDSFDYAFFKAGLSKHFIRNKDLPKEIKELIYTFHVVYGIDEMTMQNLILESSDVESGEVNRNRFIQYVQQSYFNQQKAQGIKPTEVIKSQVKEKKQIEEKSSSSSNGSFSKNEQMVIDHAKQEAPANYLQSIKDQKNGFVYSNETWVLKELVEQSGLPKEVVNILLHYILVVRETVTLEKNYTMKIANDWAQSDVRTAEDAINKIKGVYEQAKKPKAKRKYSYSKRPAGKVEFVPDWAQEEKEKTMTLNDDAISEEKQKEIMERLNRIRRMQADKEDN